MRILQYKIVYKFDLDFLSTFFSHDGTYIKNIVSLDVLKGLVSKWVMLGTIFVY